MKVEIFAGLDWSGDFTILSDDGLTPVILSDSDTGTLMVQTNGSDVECVIQPVSMTIVDADNGLFNASLSSEQTSLLKQEIGFAEDGYPSMGNYSGVLNFILESGNRQDVFTIHVKEVSSCPVIP